MMMKHAGTGPFHGGEKEATTGPHRQEYVMVIQFLQRYVRYRRVGFNRMAAFHFAWLVVSAGAKPTGLLRLGRR